MRVHLDKVLVQPWYDAEKIGSLYLPDSAKNSQPQQGKVIAAGPQSLVPIGKHIMFHPWRGEWHHIDGEDLLLLRNKDLTAQVSWVNQVPLLYPLPDHVMVEPIWSEKYKQPSRFVHLPDTVLEQNQPAMQATICDLGSGLIRMVRDFAIGDTVLIEPGKGSEVGWGYDMKVYYFVRPKHILARIENGPNT